MQIVYIHHLLDIIAQGVYSNLHSPHPCTELLSKRPIIFSLMFKYCYHY